MATTRLRRTFHYPADSDDEDTVENAVDQETIISQLSTRDTTNTNLYTRILLVLPLAPILLYLPRLLSFNTLPSSLAAIASLLSSAYILYFLPLPPVSSWRNTTSEEGKDKLISRDAYGSRSDPTAALSTPESRPVPYLSRETTELLRKCSIPANSALCACLTLFELAQGRAWREGMMIGGGYLPGFVLVFILCARRELRVVDLKELEKLKYKSSSR